MRKLLLVLFLVFLVGANSWSQATSATAVTANLENYFSTPPTWANYCLVAATGQTATSCSGALTDVYWLRFTVPVSVSTCAVKVSVIPTGFDAIVDIFDNSLAIKQCVNAAGPDQAEYLRTNPNAPDNFSITPGQTYYIRVSSTVDVSSPCFNFGLEYYAAGELRPTYSPNPPADIAPAGYQLVEVLKRTFYTTAEESLIQATSWRFVDSSTPTAAGCTYIVNSNLSQMTLYNATCVCFNKTYNVYVQLKIDNHWTGECIMRQINTEPYPLVAVQSPANCAVQGLSGQINAYYIGPNATLQWEFSVNGSVVATINGSVGSHIAYLANVPCLRYNRIYSVRGRANYCGLWGPWSDPYCLITQPVPFTQLIAGQCNSSIGRYTVLRCTAIPGATQYIWQIAEINPGQIAFPIGPATVLCTNGEYTQAGAYLTPGKTYRIGVKPVLPSNTTSCASTNTTCTTYQQGDYGMFCQVTITGGGAMAVYQDYDNGLYTVPSENEDERLLWITSGTTERIVNLNFTGKEVASSGTLRIYSATGQLVLQENIGGLASDAFYKVRLPDNLSPNMYVVNVETSAGSYSDKFIVE